MNRNTLILFGGAVLVVIMVIVATLFLGGGASPNQPNNTQTPGSYTPPSTSSGSQTLGFLTVGALVDGWKTVKNSQANIEVKLPENWDVDADTSNYNIKAGLTAQNGKIVFDVYTSSNPQNLGPLAWIKSERGINQSQPVTVGSVTGVKYEGKLVYGGGDFPYGSEEMANSYAIHLIFPRDGSMVDVRCAVSGPNYASYKSTCEEILNTFKFSD